MYKFIEVITNSGTKKTINLDTIMCLDEQENGSTLITFNISDSLARYLYVADLYKDLIDLIQQRQL